MVEESSLSSIGEHGGDKDCLYHRSVIENDGRMGERWADYMKAMLPYESIRKKTVTHKLYSCVNKYIVNNTIHINVFIVITYF